MAALQTALALDDNDCDVHRILAAVNVIQDDHEQASTTSAARSSLNPNDDLVVVQQGEVLTWLGQPEEGIEWIRKAMRLNPYHPERFWSHLARACFAARPLRTTRSRRYALHHAPDAMQRALLAACHAAARRRCRRGRAARARRRWRSSPAFRIADYLATLHYRRPGGPRAPPRGARAGGLSA